VREKIDLLEEKIQSLDKKKKIALALFLPFAIIGLFYFLYIPDAIDERQNNSVKLEKIQHDLAKHSVKRIGKKIQLLKHRILHVKSKIAQDEQKLKYLDAQLSKYNFLFISQKDFNTFLNDLLKKSVKNNFLLTDVVISKTDTKYIGKLKYKKLIQVHGSGEFLNTLKFIRGVEENEMLMQIENLNIETNGTTPFTTYDINFYGIKR
jgi:Tfp pilus assembly protein PilO